MSRLGLTRFWINFEPGENPSINGCGITAYDEADALKLLEHEVFSILETKKVVNIIRDVDVRTLDQGHVIPNMYPPNFRGVWYPKFRTL
jgi:hypothetical protein